MHWEAQLLGDSADLTMLAETFTDPSLTVLARGAEYYLLSTDFAGLASAGDVRERATEVVTVLSGAARLELGSTRGVEVGSVHRVREDGKRDITLFAEPAHMQLRGFPATIIVSTPGGELQSHRPADPLSGWLPLAKADPLVARAIRLRNQDAPNWDDLYKIYEVVTSDVRVDQVVAYGWATKASLTRFTRTANSVTAAGDDARHGVERTQPPPNPLLLADARDLIDRLLRSWLQWKSSDS